MEGQERLREEPPEQGQPRPAGVPGLGGRLHPGEGVAHPGLDPEGVRYHICL